MKHAYVHVAIAAAVRRMHDRQRFLASFFRELRRNTDRLGSLIRAFDQFIQKNEFTRQRGDPTVALIMTQAR